MAALPQGPPEPPLLLGVLFEGINREDNLRVIDNLELHFLSSFLASGLSRGWAASYAGKRALRPPKERMSHQNGV